MKDLPIQTTRMKPSGDYLCFARVDGKFIQMRYSGYTAMQARELFKQHIKSIKNDKRTNH